MGYEVGLLSYEVTPLGYEVGLLSSEVTPLGYEVGLLGYKKECSSGPILTLITCHTFGWELGSGDWLSLVPHHLGQKA